MPLACYFRARAIRFVALALACVLTTSATAPALARPAHATPAVPAWLVLRPGSVGRVDIAPWLVSDEPEAALTESATSIARDFTTHAERPSDIVYEPIGVRVRVVRVLAGGRIAFVRGRDARFVGYTLVSRLVPEIPAGTTLRAAGGFEGYSDLFATVRTPYRAAVRLETGSTLVALAMGAASYDPDTSDLIRVRVRVTSGALRGRIGWVAVVYTGLPVATVTRDAADVERACRCRIVEFGSSPEAPI